MSDNKEKQENIVGESDTHTNIDKSKRKFSKTASITAPVIMAFASRPSWVQAADANCSFRQALSGNTSPNGPNIACTKGRLSTVSPGIFAGDGGDLKWEQFGVGGLRDKPFQDVFGSNPEVELLPELRHPDFGTTLENALKAHKKDFVTSPEFFSKGGNFHNQIFHFIGAYLMASTTQSPNDPNEGGGPALVYPYTPQEISDNWKLENRSLYSILQALQTDHLDVADASGVTGIDLP